MTKPILAGYDPTGADTAPVRFGLQAARFTGAPLVVASVAGARGVAAGVLDEGMTRDATEQLDTLMDELAPEGVWVKTRELRGTSAARALHEAAEELGAGLLVVGSTRRGELGRILPGSTAERLMHGAPCPVAVVPHKWQPRGVLETIGVAYVDTPEGREALHGAHALARRAGARLRVITVVQRSPIWYSETEAKMPPRPPKDFEDVEGEHRVMAEKALQRAVAELRDDVPVEVEALIGDPGEVLVDLSERFDLLVCGSRGYGPLRAVLLGGVSRRVAVAAHCPAIVLPRGVASPLEELMADEPATA
jgi:nucleotide-binding universal stress UspA family protein